MLAMSRWRLGLIESLPAGMPRMRAISSVTLPPGSTPPLPGFAPCDSLISNAFTCRASSFSLLRRQAAVGVAHAVLRGAHLHDDVAAAFEVMRREAALAGVHPAPGELRAARERAHRRRGDRAEAHAADVDDGLRLERLPAIPFADRERRRRQALLLQHREGVVHEDDRARLAQVVGGAEADDAALVLGEPVDEGARRPVERHLRAVAGEEILAEVLAQILEEEAQPPDDRVVAQDRVLLLGDVLNDGDNEPGDQREAEYRADTVLHHHHHAVHRTLRDAAGNAPACMHANIRPARGSYAKRSCILIQYFTTRSRENMSHGSAARNRA